MIEKYDETGLTKAFIAKMAGNISNALLARDSEKLTTAIREYLVETIAHEPDPYDCAAGFFSNLMTTMTSSMMPPPKTEPAADDRDGFVCGTGLDDSEHGHYTGEVYNTREEAIAAGQNDVGWTDCPDFQTARIVHSTWQMPNQLDAENACDRAENSEWGEALMEQWQEKVFGSPEVLGELQQALDMIWDAWSTKNKLEVSGYTFEDVESHEFTRNEESDDGAPPTT